MNLAGWVKASDSELEAHVFTAADLDDPPFRWLWPDGSGAYWGGEDWVIYDDAGAGGVLWDDAVLYRKTKGMSDGPPT